MIFLAVFSSKLCFALSCMLALPVLIFLHQILTIWLGNIPEYTEIFCRYMILCFLIQQIYPGLNRAIYATGQIKYYQIYMFIVFTSILPCGVILFKFGFAPYGILFFMILSQLIFMGISVYFAKKLCSLNSRKFIVEGIIIPIAVFAFVLLISSVLLSQYYIQTIWGIILASSVIIIVFLALTFLLTFRKDEKIMLINLVSTLANKLCLRK